VVRAVRLTVADIAARLQQPPPRRVTAELVRAVERPSRPMLMWGGVALSCVGGGYTLIFTALRAPWQILGGAATVAVTGAALLTAFAIVTAGLRRLLRDGLLVDGEILEVDAPVGGQGKRPRPARLRYRFTSPEGETVTARDAVLWTDPPPPIAAGDMVPVCVLPGRCRRHLVLLPEAASGPPSRLPDQPPGS